MPVKIKVMFSVLVLVVAALGAWFLDWLGNSTASWVALFFGVFSVASFWIFPEVGGKKGD